MSVANIIIADRAVRIVSDTLTYCGKTPVEFNRKVTIRNEACLAVTVRGRRWIGVGFADLSARWSGFDRAIAETIEAIPGIVKLSNERGGGDGGFEVTVAGWRNGPAVTRITYSADSNEITRHDLSPGVYLAPSLGPQEWPDANSLTNDHLIKIAGVQQALSRKHGLNMCVSGDIELTTVDWDGARTEKLASYPDKAMIARRMKHVPPTMLDRAVA